MPSSILFISTVLLSSCVAPPPPPPLSLSLSLSLCGYFIFVSPVTTASNSNPLLVSTKCEVNKTKHQSGEINKLTSPPFCVRPLQPLRYSYYLSSLSSLLGHGWKMRCMIVLDFCIGQESIFALSHYFIAVKLFPNP